MKTSGNIFRNLLNGLLVISLVLVLSNCSSDQPRTRTNKEVLDKSEIEDKVREIIYPLPTSFEVVEMLNQVGAAYIIDISNDVENAEKYFTNKDQAINLGIYAADLSYASIYNMKQYTISYMEAMQQLVKELGITSVFTSEILENVETNLNNKDELVEIITFSFYDTYEYLVKHDREDLSLLFVAGSWIEGLYISTHISEFTFRDPEIVKIILDQKSSLRKLLEILAPHTDHETIQQLIQDLTPIMEVYRGMDDTGITETELNEIIERIEVIRENIVS